MKYFYLAFSLTLFSFCNLQKSYIQAQCDMSFQASYIMGDHTLSCISTDDVPSTVYLLSNGGSNSNVASSSNVNILESCASQNPAIDVTGNAAQGWYADNHTLNVRYYYWNGSQWDNTVGLNGTITVTNTPCQGGGIGVVPIGGGGGGGIGGVGIVPVIGTPPVILAPNSGNPYAANYAENGVGTIESVSANDADGDNVIFTLSGTDAADFSIDGSGVVTFVSSPDYENPADDDQNNIYVFTVVADDGNLNRDTQDWTITVTDVNEGSTPTITSSGSIGSFTSCSGVVGSEQSFDISGSNLTDDITVTAPTGYEVSKTSGSGYSGSITYAQSSGTVSLSTVYVRLTSSASNNASGNVACTSSGATQVDLATGSGTVTTTVTPSVTIASSDMDDSFCSGTSVTFTATPTNGGGGPTYQWKSGGSAISGETGSTYTSTGISNNEQITVTMTANNTCQSASTATSSAITNTVTAPPTSGTISGTNSIAIGQTSQLSISGNSASGTWGTSNSSLATVSGSGLVTGVAAGSPNITYTVSGSGGCSDATDTYAVTVTSSIANVISGNWNDPLTWGTAGVPTAGDDIIIQNDITINSNTADLGNITVNSGATLTVGAYTLEFSGTLDIDGTLSIGASSVVNADGTYDASGGNTTFSGAGTLKISGTVTSFGTLTPSSGTIVYDGGTQNVLSETYNNLEIDQSGTKTAQGAITVNGTMNVNSSATYSLAATTTSVTGSSDIDGTLTVSTGTYDANGTFDATGGNVTFTGSGRLELGGTVTSLGTFTGGGNSTVSYNSASTQTIDDFGAKSGPYDNLDLNGGGQKDLSGNTTIDGVLSWSADCDMTTNGHTLTIKQSPTGYNDNRVITGGSSSTVSVAYSSSSTNECFVPVGIDGSVRDISIMAASATAETYTVVYTPGSPGTINWNTTPTGVAINPSADAAHVNNHYYYDISRSGSVNATLKLKFAGLVEPTDNSDKYVMHWNSGTNRWDQLSSTGASGYVTALATSFSPFGQGSGGGALPIDLVSFTGKCENHTTELEFVVGSQINNDYYTIERSADGNEWSEVGIIEGEGNTSTQMTYKWIDDNPISGVSYYRLTQTDYDGTSEIFAPVAVTCEMTPIDGYSVYPNPADGLLNIDIELENHQGEGVSIEVTDINGRTVKNQVVQLKRGFNHLEMDLNEIPSGIYMFNFVGSKDYIKESRITKK